MNRVNKRIGYSLLAGVLLSSCAKHEMLDYLAGKPESVIAQEDINSYAPLMSYIDRNAHPNFKWGVALNMDDYLNRGVMYRLVNRNFEEMVMGYEMKHSSIVQADGSLNLSKLERLITAAKENNMALFGHTLTWHSGQNATYLNSLIAPIKLPGGGGPTWDIVTSNDFESSDNGNYEYNTNAVVSFTANGQGANGEGRALKLENESVRTNDWDVQFFIKFSPVVKAGERYTLSIDMKSDAAATFGTQAHLVPYSYKHYEFFGSFSTTPTWATFTKEIIITPEMADCSTIAFNLGKHATTFYFDNLKLTKYNEEGTGGSSEAGYALKLTNPTVVNAWEAQTVHDLTGIENNTEYILKVAAKGSKAGNISFDLQSTADYQGNGFGAIALTTDYKEYELKLTTTALRNRFIINHGQYNGTALIDHISLTKAGSNTNLLSNGDFENGISPWGGWGNSSTRSQSAKGEGYGGPGGSIIEKTPEEKKSILTEALETFIAGMLSVTKDYVKAWDVVNEPMSDWPDQYALKTGVGKAELAEDEFYWQDYLGKDYAVQAIQFARQYGNPADILFINDYGLEGGGNKCKGLIAYVDYVESQGVTVDGIGTQMHIDIKTNKDNIINMYELLAATGKLIKVSELDIGLGDGIKTPNATAEMYQKQAEMYKFVIEKYFEIIPKAQQYGITVWSPLDSPDNQYSFWRRGEPIGLWTESFVRKPAYQAVAEALEKQK
ncbi:hypothetical protein FAZ15_18285 [Sphingobacterium olei]|uniref:endo-1,4-beta-xylanase n=1 Tax=Sphingobacterium olei TaxID=2571155 RepID=A0A4U0NGU2_9SPHI|nr:endo-1,4-beta-xylanase [Sphingobacterium olei]TJZ53300.1 hypothetical protein FAZ15_18285 [Sphingobacterium olei]